MAYILLFSWLLPGHDGAGRTDLTSELAVPEPSEGSPDAKPAAANAVAYQPLGKSGVLAAVGTARPVAVRTATGTVTAPLPVDLVLSPGDVVVVSGAAGDIAKYALANGLEVVTYGGSAAAGAHASSDAEAEAGAKAASSSSSRGGAGDEGALYQVTVARRADVIGRTIRETGFRGRFDAAVIAVKRNKVRQAGRIGDLELRAGDVLVLSAGANFDAGSADFKANFKSLERLDEAVQREYTTAMVVTGAALDGKTIEQAGLRGVTGLFLFEIHRANGEVLRAVAPTTALKDGDVLFFAGDLASVSFLMKFDGLEHQQQRQLRKLPAHQVDRALVQAVVSPHSTLAHRTAREARFRSTYGAALLSVHRAGQALTGDGECCVLEGAGVGWGQKGCKGGRSCCFACCSPVLLQTQQTNPTQHKQRQTTLNNAKQHSRRHQAPVRRRARPRGRPRVRQGLRAQPRLRAHQRRPQLGTDQALAHVARARHRRRARGDADRRGRDRQGHRAPVAGVDARGRHHARVQVHERRPGARVARLGDLR